jgi:hypothetical protein
MRDLGGPQLRRVALLADAGKDAPFIACIRERLASIYLLRGEDEKALVPAGSG